MSVTRGHSCVLCHQRKVRCDQQKPCANCVKVRAECIVIPSQPPRRRVKKKLEQRDLIERLNKYEKILAQHGINFDSIPDVQDNVDDSESHIHGSNTPAAVSDNRKTEEDDKNSKWIAYYEEVSTEMLISFQSRLHEPWFSDRYMDTQAAILNFGIGIEDYSKLTLSQYRTAEDMLHGSSDEEYDRPTIHHSFDTMFTDVDAFPFGVGGMPLSVTGFHPPAIRIFQLWQVYLDNVNPLLKISHAPTLQVEIVEAAADLATVPKGLEALMFGIYFTSINSMSDKDVLGIYHESKATLIGRYYQGAQQALINAGFMRSNEIVVLQAYVLYLVGAANFMDPRSLFCLIGMCVRIATRLGLHRDGAQFNFSPFEAEQRRRLWWQIVILDKRIAEITGSTITALSSSGADCRLPLNVNDTDLSPYTKEPPIPSNSATEMIFCLTRIELTIASFASGIGPNPAIVNNPAMRGTSFPPTPSVTPDGYNHPEESNLDGYSAYLESKYLKDCDSNIPLHNFALLMTRMLLCRLRVLGAMSPRVTITDQERGGLFTAAIEMLEYDNTIQSNETLSCFLWSTRLQAPVQANILLANQLRECGTGLLCERAWKALSDNYEHRELARNIRSPMHAAFKNKVLRAWDAHEEAERRLGRSVRPPRVIALLRQHFPESSNSRDAGAGMTHQSHMIPVDLNEDSLRTGSIFESGEAFHSYGLMASEDLVMQSLSYIDEISQ
ncbi:hypothetical protein NCU04390 [Paecilomyces variotii No. 5]|uniref:Zn(2)-C6 fungal-type domain-containing protein n=1 Tax=Byssochlamys spectabilis (strain No. 5 / NBRC 109023) TaxID=1356009 RepID=V5FWA5_BYSSN|nr:hypothetical protein NCU04390 [Paecilomyces variotii No. 5]